MAANKQLKEEISCSVCLEYFTDPVFLECEHVFCLSCITRCWEGLQTDFPCPQCRETSKNKTLKPNRHFGNIVELLKQLHTPSATPQDENLCREHEEKLKLFCEDDQETICVICRESRDHKAHSVLPIQEAAQEYKKRLNADVERLKKELKHLHKWAAEQSRTASKVEGSFKNQVEVIHSTFELLKKFLNKEEQQLLSKLENEHKENMKNIQEKLSDLEKQQSTHRDLITEIEGKCQQQDVELLKEVKIILNRYSNAKAQKPPKDVAVGQTLESIGEHSFLQDKLLELKEAFPAELEKRYIKPATFPTAREWAYIRNWACEVTLDPDTANQELILSEDGRNVRLGDTAQDLPDTPQRFTNYVDVLGTQRMTSGRHYWEVEVGEKTEWTVGVCDEAVDRKGAIPLAPKNGYWVVWLRDGEFEALTSSSTLLTPRVPPRAVGLFLDYAAGRLSFYNVNDRSLLFTFSEVSFPPTLRPYFSPETNDGGRNAGALRIQPVAKDCEQLSRAR
ncbi:E3 ubiquitin-protein ligase TRIM39-like isoform X2 [Lissotriton helveticus]